MRHPVKPFVTEYKGNTRRPPSPAGLSLKVEEEDHSAPARRGASKSDASRAADNQRFAGASHSSEDSYEAALRAADALFSNAPQRSKGRSQAVDEAGETVAASVQTSSATAKASGATPPASGAGRILRVIDEAPPQALMDLEVERQPKRRGRKPGSKNKPKLVPAFVASPGETRAGAAAPAVAARQVNAGVEPPTREAPAAPDADRAPAQAPTQAVAPIVARRPRLDPYAWVRTKLKPGERWKRRLPKVAW